MSGAVELWRWGDRLEPLVELLDRGGFLGIPTESSYGLAADPASAAGVASIMRWKGRPAGRPLPVVVADLEQIRRLGADPAPAERCGLTALWPAPLTVVLPIRHRLPAAAGGDTLGFRIPDHAGLRTLLQRLGRGLTATSANPSGAAPLVDPGELRRALRGTDALVIDGGVLPGGAPSTLVEVDDEGWRLLRSGRLAVEKLPPSRRADAARDGISAATVEIPVERKVGSPAEPRRTRNA